MADVRGGRRGLRIPLALLVSRYFLYALAGALIAVGVPLGIFMWQMGSGTVLAANYGEVHLEGTERVLAKQGSFDESAIPSAYRYAHFDENGGLIASDMENHQVEVARSARASATGEVPGAVKEDASSFYSAVELTDGGSCVFCYDIMPQWADKGARDALPNPQNLLVWTVLVALVLTIALIALRAAHVLTRKMGPLARAAEAVGRQDLDTSVGNSGVAEVDDVLRAMEAMRVSLKESLEAQWAAERQSREQVAALAHDLKTPLTVMRGNAELLAEDAASGALDANQAACVQALREAALSVDSFVSRIVEASRGQVGGMRFEPTDPEALFDRLESAARELVAARGFELEVSRTPAFASLCDTVVRKGALPRWDGDALVRAVLNLTGNACDHANDGHVALVFSFDAGARAVSIAVEDDGPGFSPGALEHGTERFFRGDASRADAADMASGPHFGLGLAIASDVAVAHDGTLELSNRTDGAGAVLGARATIALPLA